MKQILLITLLFTANTLFSQNYQFLGKYTSDGTPLYLESERDDVSAVTLELISSALPESYPVPDYNPHYISSGYDTDISITAPADVWITFVQEGAGYRNVLGFFTYPTGNPPASIPSANDITIIFPNVSAKGSGGSLLAGDKVKIGTFAPGTSISWVLLANGWNGKKVTAGNAQLFSNPDYNPEADVSLRHHNVLLADPENKRVILGFEDIRRDYRSCDNDFNDAIFYVSANPYEAMQTANLTDVKSATDVTSANTGGLESNGSLAGLIAKRNFNRTKTNSFADLKKFQERFDSSSRMQLKSAQVASLESYIPESGMFGTETAHISSPDDLIGITNAKRIFSVDYYSGENRISAILATETSGKIYDHTKVICDRLNNSNLEDVRTVTVRGHQIIASSIQRASGELEHAISFSVKKGTAQNELYSYWSTNQYPEGDYYNFQIWGASFSQVFALANQILDRFSAEKPLTSQVEEATIPTLFVRSGHYSNGEIHLNLVNKSASTELRFNGNISPAENTEHISIDQIIPISGAWNETVTINTGSLFDIGLSITSEESAQADALYLADGPWGLDYLETETTIDEFTVGNNPVPFSPNSHAIERQPSLRGEVKGTVNLFRQVLPGHLSLDVTAYSSLAISVANTQPIEIVLMTDELRDWSNRLRTSIPANAEMTDYQLSFDDFLDGTGQKASIERVNRIVFSVQGNYVNFQSFSVDIQEVAFTNTLTTTTNQIELDETNGELTNFPNPFVNYTTIQLPFLMDQATIKVFDLMGRLVDNQQLPDARLTTEVQYQSPGLSPDLYFYVVVDERGEKYSGRFIVQ